MALSDKAQEVKLILLRCLVMVADVYYWEGQQFVDGGAKLAVMEVDRHAEVVAHLRGFPHAFLEVASEAESVKQRIDAVA
jgi:hypothetical protein